LVNKNRVATSYTTTSRKIDLKSYSVDHASGLRVNRRIMPLPQGFLEQLPLKSDAELYDMLAHQDDYLPEALAAAKDELNKRNLAPERVAQIEATVQSQKAAAESKAQERLGWPMRIFIFLFCAGLVGAVLAVYYDSKGYNRKAADCWLAMGVSIAFYLAIGVFAWLTK
jgi:phosphotransferase system  glucose/maltose/N-acetylglucosamine-specific IIC component